MATQNIISYLRLLIFVSLSVQVGAQTIITTYDEGYIHVGDDAVIYYDNNDRKYTLDPDHEYFEGIPIDASDKDHFEYLTQQIIKMTEINKFIKSQYIDNERYKNTNDEGVRSTRNMLTKQYSRRSFIILQYTNTAKEIESRISQ